MTNGNDRNVINHNFQWGSSTWMNIILINIFYDENLICYFFRYKKGEGDNADILQSNNNTNEMANDKSILTITRYTMSMIEN